MTFVRRIARPLLASTFIAEGLAELRNTAKEPQRADSDNGSRERLAADGMRKRLTEKVPYLPDDPATLAKLNAGVMVGAGSMLALGRLPRLSALLLAGTVVPATLASPLNWDEDDPAYKARQRKQFFKSCSLLGGLMLASVDTEGQPGVAWRLKHASHHTATGSRRVTRTARREAKLAAHAARARLPG